MAGRNLLLGLLSSKSFTSTSSLSSKSVAVNGNRLDRMLPLVFPEARGLSFSSPIVVVFSSLTGARVTGCLALFPVGTIRILFRDLPPLLVALVVPDPLAPLSLGFEKDPLEGSANCLSSCSSSGTAPLTACEGPGKSSGTIGLPLTRDIIGGGVGDSCDAPLTNSCKVARGDWDDDDATSSEGILSLGTAGFLGNSRTGTLSLTAKRPAGVGVVGRDLTLDTGRLDNELTCTSDVCDSDEPTDPTVVEKGRRRTLAPLIKSC